MDKQVKAIAAYRQWALGQGYSEQQLDCDHELKEIGFSFWECEKCHMGYLHVNAESIMKKAFLKGYRAGSASGV